MANILWKGDLHDGWFEARNWDPNNIPGPGDTATIGPAALRNCVCSGGTTIRELAVSDKMLEWTGILLVADRSIIGSVVDDGGVLRPGEAGAALMLDGIRLVVNGGTLSDGPHRGRIHLFRTPARLVTNGEADIPCGSDIRVGYDAGWFNNAQSVTLKNSAQVLLDQGSLGVIFNGGDKNRDQTIARTSLDQLLRSGSLITVSYNSDTIIQLAILVYNGGVIRIVEGEGNSGTLRATGGNTSTGGYGIYLENGEIYIGPQDRSLFGSSNRGNIRLAVPEGVYVASPSSITLNAAGISTSGRFQVLGYVINTGGLWAQVGTIDLSGGGTLQGWIFNWGGGPNIQAIGPIAVVEEAPAIGAVLGGVAVAPPLLLTKYSLLLIYSGTLVLGGTSHLHYTLDTDADHRPPIGQLFPIITTPSGGVIGEFSATAFIGGRFTVVYHSSGVHLRYLGQ